MRCSAVRDSSGWCVLSDRRDAAVDFLCIFVMKGFLEKSFSSSLGNARSVDREK